MSTNKSAEKILVIADLLLVHFVHGLTATDIINSTGYSAPNVSRYIATLEETGWAERIPETKRIRASMRVAQRAAGVLADINAAKQRLDETAQRMIIK